ncbi:hydroxyethylthiazole kinase [Gordonia alkanivorans NBRC 16433]|jgi:hydroxyethylthiazole kinase|uniref:hydroxyethylthiazole kinase n=2 Tax=Gordoniaceae TaxID=85026 RepID=F9VYU9_9ACTN|nr:hydroxyethylthiazole kinase [Gordonia alkanivorans NBRC 16433]
MASIVAQVGADRSEAAWLVSTRREFKYDLAGELRIQLYTTKCSCRRAITWRREADIPDWINQGVKVEMETTTIESSEVKTAIARLREKAPFVYGLTNYVAANLSANVLLALGAGPAIGSAPGWAAAFPAGAGAVWINGAALMSSVTPDELDEAAATAHKAGTPWVLDPVAIGAGASEYDAILASLARRLDAVIAVSGEVDYLCDPAGRATAVPGGDAKMPQVTGTGCSLGALSAAFCAVVDPFTAAAAAHVAFATAGERAGERATGTASFAIAFVDELSLL